MNENLKCGIGDLLSLFNEKLDSAEILSSKLMAQVSSIITSERLRLHMNQKDFATYIGASQSQISRWEHGDYNFSIRKISEVASKLDLDVNISMSPLPAAQQLQTDEITSCNIILFPAPQIYSDNTETELKEM